MTTATTEATHIEPWRGAGIAIGAALVANLVVLFAGNALMDGSIQVVMQGSTTASDLPVAAVIAASIVPTVLGAVGLWVLGKIRPGRAFGLWRTAVVVLTVLSLAPVMMLDVSTASKVALTLMHFATGAAALAGQTLASRSA